MPEGRKNQNSVFRSLHSLQQESHILREYCNRQLVDCIEQVNGNRLVRHSFLLSLVHLYLDHYSGEVGCSCFAAQYKESTCFEECQIEQTVVEGVEVDSRMAAGLMP